MALSRYEEIVFRELQAMAGDMSQVAENITRDHEERVTEAEERAARRRKETPSKPQPIMTMRVFDRPGLTKDLTFLRDRLNLLLDYTKPEPHDPNVPGMIKQ